MNNWRFLSKIEGYNKFLSDFVQDIMEELLKLFIGLVPNLLYYTICIELFEHKLNLSRDLVIR